MSDFASIFGVKTLKEPFNRKAALYLQAHISDFESDPTKQASSKDSIDRLIAQSRGESFIRVAYGKAAASAGKRKGAVKDHGRWFAKTPGAMQGICRLIRQTVCAELWIDVDFVNCHPVILAGMCRTVYRVPCPFLEKYLKHREVMLKEMVEGELVESVESVDSDVESEAAQSTSANSTAGSVESETGASVAFDAAAVASVESDAATAESATTDAVPATGKPRGILNREEAKKIVLKVLNGGIVKDVQVSWWNDMCKEFANIASAIALHPDNTHYLQECKNDKRGDNNLHARTMSAVLCNEENRCLEELFAFLKEEGLVVDQCSLIFDGLMIQDNPTNRQKVAQPGFFEEVSDRIYKVTGHQLEAKVKEFDEVYELPADYADTVSDIFLIDAGNDGQAATEFIRRNQGMLVKSQGRTFWMKGGVYTEHPKMVREGIVGGIRDMEIYMKTSSKFGDLIPYSQNRRHIDDCVKLVMDDETVEDPSFIDKLYSSSLQYLAFEDGVYSFKTKELLPYPVEGVYFTFKIHRLFPRNVDPEVTKMVMDRVLVPIFPDEKQMGYYLHRMSRSLAGEVVDKVWHVCIGERNSGKGVLCDFLKKAFQEFVHTFNSESLLCNNMPNADAAKAQSWISPLEFKRVIVSNEMKLLGGRARLDGNMIKRLASGGDEIQTRTNHKDEVNKRIQCTMWLHGNEIATVDPPDAYQTLQVFSFQSAFIPVTEMKQRGNACPRHWKPEDPTIKTWINTPDVVDAFTMIVLEYYDVLKLPVPYCVSKHSDQFKGASSVRDIDRFAEVVKYDPISKRKTFLDEIALALEKAGLKGLSKNNIQDYVAKLYGNKTFPEGFPPTYGQFTKEGKRGYGFTRIKLEDIVEFNPLEEKRAENLRRSEAVKQQVRNEGSELGKRTFDEI
jgi:hypothetical protein